MHNKEERALRFCQGHPVDSYLGLLISSWTKTYIMSLQNRVNKVCNNRGRDPEPIVNDIRNISKLIWFGICYSVLI